MNAFDIDKNTIIDNNIVYYNKEIYGGGAVYLGFIPNGTHVSIFGNYTNNKVFFPFINETLNGSEHGEGGAIKIDWVEGTVGIAGNFIGNKAPDGAAINVMVCVV